MMTSRQHAEIARAAGSFTHLCECQGLTFFAHHPVGHVLDQITPAEHRAQFTEDEYE